MKRSAATVHPNQIKEWKKKLVGGASEVFSRENKRHSEKDQEAFTNRLYEQIGQLQVELNWLKKSLNIAVKERKQWIEPQNSELSMSRQCELLEICRSGLYYRTKGEDSDNEQLTRLMDEQYTATPFYGYPRMTAWLRREGHLVNKKRVAKLMNQMGLQAVFPKPNLSKPSREHRVYP